MLTYVKTFKDYKDFRLIYNLVTLLRNAVIEQVVSPHIDDAKIVTELSEPTLNTDQDLLY